MFLNKFKTLMLQDDSGSFLAEYGLITGTVATALIGALGFLTNGFDSLLEGIQDTLIDMTDNIKEESNGG